MRQIGYFSAIVKVILITALLGPMRRSMRQMNSTSLRQLRIIKPQIGYFPKTLYYLKVDRR